MESVTDNFIAELISAHDTCLAGIINRKPDTCGPCAGISVEDAKTIATLCIRLAQWLGSQQNLRSDEVGRP
jgi:hypothetical protein